MNSGTRSASRLGAQRCKALSKDRPITQLASSSDGTGNSRSTHADWMACAMKEVESMTVPSQSKITALYCFTCLAPDNAKFPCTPAAKALRTPAARRSEDAESPAWTHAETCA